MAPDKTHTIENKLECSVKQPGLSSLFRLQEGNKQFSNNCLAVITYSNDAFEALRLGQAAALKT